MTANTRVAEPLATPAAASRRWPARVFVGAVWLLSTLGLLGYVYHYGTNVPFFDDWHMVPYLTGDQPVTLHWLWSQHGDHRVPLSRLLLLGLGKLCGYDFRSGMVFNVLALSATSLVLIGVSRRLRGRLSIADAFVPLLLLNPGQWETYLWCWIASLTLPITLALIVLGIMALWGLRPPVWATFVAGILTLAMPLADSAGLAFVPALIVWFVTAAVSAWRSPGASSWLTRSVPLAFAFAAVGLLAVYYIGYTRLQGGENKPGIPDAMRTTIEFLSMGIGHASVLIWPLSALIVLGLLVSAAFVLGRIKHAQPLDRSRVGALLFFFAGTACLALALGWGRGGEGANAGFKSRYVVMALPVPCAVFMSWACYRGRLRTIVQSLMCLLMFLLLPLNIKTAIDSAENFRPQFAAFEQDLRDGKTPSLLAERHTNVLFPWPVDAPDKQLVHDRLLMLQRAGIGPYRDMAADVPLREVPVSFLPEDQNAIRAKLGLPAAMFGDPYLPYHLEKPENVAAVRIRYSFANPQAQAAGLVVHGKESGKDEFTRAELGLVPPIFILGPVHQEEVTVLAYINGGIDQLRIEAVDERYPFSIYEIVLFVKDR